MSDAEGWIVRAGWADSGPTYHGLFSYYEHAEAWAREQLDEDAGCVRYELGVLTPAGSSMAGAALFDPDSRAD